MISNTLKALAAWVLVAGIMLFFAMTFKKLVPWCAAHAAWAWGAMMFQLRKEEMI
jgi:hypothetical protein